MKQLQFPQMSVNMKIFTLVSEPVLKAHFSFTSSHIMFI